MLFLKVLLSKSHRNCIVECPTGITDMMMTTTAWMHSHAQCWWWHAHTSTHMLPHTTLMTTTPSPTTLTTTMCTPSCARTLTQQWLNDDETTQQCNTWWGWVEDERGGWWWQHEEDKEDRWWQWSVFPLFSLSSPLPHSLTPSLTPSSSRLIPLSHCATNDNKHKYENNWWRQPDNNIPYLPSPSLFLLSPCSLALQHVEVTT